MAFYGLMHRFVSALLAGAIIGLSGVPILMLQLFGWGLMLNRYLDIMPLEDAIEFTLRHTSNCGYEAFVEEEETDHSVPQNLLSWSDCRLMLPTAFMLRPSCPSPTGRFGLQKQLAAVPRADCPEAPPPKSIV